MHPKETFLCSFDIRSLFTNVSLAETIQISADALYGGEQRWSPRGHILKSLALALKVNSLALASRPQVLENWPVLGSRTALFFELLRFCGALWKTFFCGDRLKNFCEDLFFFLESTCACVLGPWPWPRAFLSLASRVSVLGKAVLGLGLGLGFFCVLGFGPGFEPCVLDSTSGGELIHPDYPKEIFVELMNTANKSVEFSFNNNMCKQIDGVAIGSSLSVALANIFVGYHESKLFESTTKLFLYH